MKVKFKEFRFLVFFLPLFILKLLDITSESKILMATSIICFASIVFGFIREKIETKKLSYLLLLALYTGVLVIVAGKQGAFFSAVMILALYGIESKQRLYRILFYVGSAVVILAYCMAYHTGGETIRFIDGEWTSMFKRSNLLAVSYMAVFTLWLLLHSYKKITIKQFVAMGLLCYGVFIYTGSRTGGMIILLLIIEIFLFQFKRFQRNKIVKYLCIGSPAIAMFASYMLAFLYGKNILINYVDNMMQGRLRQGNMYLEKYDLLLFGQKIFESSSSTDFWNLDCAYLDMLICYGVIFAVLWVVVSCFVIKYLYDRKRYIEVSIIVAYSIYGISETFLPNCFLNTSLFLYAEWFYAVLNKKRNQVTASNGINYQDISFKTIKISKEEQRI